MNIENLSACELADLITGLRKNSKAREQLFAQARAVRDSVYGPNVFFRGLIEISNFCVRDCYYCGIRHSRQDIRRYRLSEDEIFSCCYSGYGAGYRTFVLQSGEDPCLNDGYLINLVGRIKSAFPDCAVTLSLGELPEAVLKKLFTAGADRYLLRHETADELHFSHLHPSGQTFSDRIKCLEALKNIGFQTGAGMMIGSPGQTLEHLVSDLLFLHSFQPHMVGIGPFLPSSGTPFADQPAGSLVDTLIMIALTRIILPHALIPATTALGSLNPGGRQAGLLAGANVLMPNLTPPVHKSDYLLYDCKVLAADDATENFKLMSSIVSQADMTVDQSRGDHIYNKKRSVT
jgi:biotin synthase